MCTPYTANNNITYLFVTGRLQSFNSSSSGSFEKYLSTILSVTPSKSHGFHLGSLSRSTNTARTPS